MNKLLVFAIVVLFSLHTFAQNKHITYIGEVFSVSFYNDSVKKPHSDYQIKKGYHHILVFKDRKAISFRLDTTLTSGDSSRNIMPNHKFLSLFDKKQNATKTITTYYNKKADKVFFSDRNPDVWKSIAPDKEPVYSEQEKEWLAFVFQRFDSIPKWTAPVYQYTDSVKTIHGYNCKNVYVKDGKREYNVWYTEEIYYNWCFDDYRFLIPGTVIYIEYDNKPYLEFVSIEDLDYDKLPLEKKIVKEVLKKW